MAFPTSVSTPEVADLDKKEFYTLLSSCRPNALSPRYTPFFSKPPAITVAVSTMKARFIHLNRRVRALEAANISLKNQNSSMRSEITLLREELQVSRASNYQSIENRRKDAAAREQSAARNTLLATKLQRYGDFIYNLASIGLNNPVYRAALSVMSVTEAHTALMDSIKEAARDKSSHWCQIVPSVVRRRNPRQQLRQSGLVCKFWRGVAKTDNRKTVLLTPASSRAAGVQGVHDSGLGDENGFSMESSEPVLDKMLNQLKQENADDTPFSIAECPSSESMDESELHHGEIVKNATGLCDSAPVFQATSQKVRHNLDAEHLAEVLAGKESQLASDELPALPSNEDNGRSVVLIVTDDHMDAGHPTSKANEGASVPNRDLGSTSLLQPSPSDCAVVSSGSEYSQLSAELTGDDLAFSLTKRTPVASQSDLPQVEQSQVAGPTPRTSKPANLREKAMLQSPRTPAGFYASMARAMSPPSMRSKSPGSPSTPPRLVHSMTRDPQGSGSTQKTGSRATSPDVFGRPTSASLSSAPPSALKRPVLRSIDLNRSFSQHGRRATNLNVATGSKAGPSKPKALAKNMGKRRGVIMTEKLNIESPVVARKRQSVPSPPTAVDLVSCSGSPDLSRFDPEVVKLATSYSNSDLGSLETSESEPEPVRSAPTAKGKERDAGVDQESNKATHLTKGLGLTSAVFSRTRPQALILATAPSFGQAGEILASSSSGSMTSFGSTVSCLTFGSPIHTTAGSSKPALFGSAKKRPAVKKVSEELPSTPVAEVSTSSPKAMLTSIKTLQPPTGSSLPSPQVYRSEKLNRTPESVGKGKAVEKPVIPLASPPSKTPTHDVGKLWMGQNLFSRFTSSESKGKISRTAKAAVDKLSKGPLSPSGNGSLPSKPRANTISTLIPSFARSKALEPPSPATKPRANTVNSYTPATPSPLAREAATGSAKPTKQWIHPPAERAAPRSPPVSPRLPPRAAGARPAPSGITQASARPPTAPLRVTKKANGAGPSATQQQNGPAPPTAAFMIPKAPVSRKGRRVGSSVTPLIPSSADGVISEKQCRNLLRNSLSLLVR